MKKNALTFSILPAFLLLFSLTSQAQLIDDTSGGNGSITGVGQSYNESRAMDATVISTSPLHITAMTIKFLNSGADNTVMLGARVYNTSTMSLLYSHDTTLTGQFINATRTMPVSYTLMPGQTYRIGFFCGGPASDNSAGMYQPTFPYNESNNLLQINAGKESIADSYPNNINIFIPVMTLTYNLSTGVDIINSTDQTIDLFPNPFNDELTVNNASNELQQIIIYDMSSRKLMEEKFNSSATINTNELSKGIYFLQVTSPDGIMKTRKLVKQ